MRGVGLPLCDQVITTEEGCKNLACDVAEEEEGCDAGGSEGKRGSGICGEEGSCGEEELQRRQLFGFINRAKIFSVELSD
ncbi:hypothetical protein U1Q18_003595 [Sarracenia purpurea var. burkii]